MKHFDIPAFYKSPLISELKKIRQDKDPRKKDYSPTLMNFGPVRFLIGRHFGFCYGVENAIEISYRAIEENPGKKIYLLSEIIHNPEVNNDLIGRGVKFISDTSGKLLIEWKEINPDDIIIIPAFGITVEVRKRLEEIGMKTLKYDTTCPFVEKVWNRASSLGLSNHTIIVHGKYRHEETRATFSHSKENAPTLIVRDIEETKMLGDFISGKRKNNEFYEIFKDKHSEGFDPSLHLKKIGVVNQTTMLAEETQAIADFLKGVMEKKYEEENIKEHFSDTRDTLCYATHDNQRATLTLLEKEADIAIVVGGYNSSNTSHIVELCEKRIPTYFISSCDKLYSKDLISHFDIHNHKMLMTDNYLPDKTPATIILTSGASCPDSVAEEVLKKILSYYDKTRSVDEILNDIRKENSIR